MAAVWKWAGDPRQPQRIDTDEYRRAVFRGELTPDGRPAIDGVAINQPVVNAATEIINDALMHRDDQEN